MCGVIPTSVLSSRGPVRARINFLSTATLRTMLPFSPVRPACFDHTDGNDVEAGALRISDADREIKCRFEVVACVELFLS